jgi:hypothetical protein
VSGGVYIEEENNDKSMNRVGWRSVREVVVVKGKKERPPNKDII